MKQLHDILSDIYDQLTGSDGLSKVRARAWDTYRSLGLPSRENEAYRHVRLRSFYEEEYSVPDQINVSASAEDQPAIVLVNGIYRPDLSVLPEGVVVTPLPLAMRTYGAFLNNRLAKGLKEERDPFVALNGAIHQEGLFLYVPPKQVLTSPIRLRHCIAVDQGPVVVTPRLHVFVGAGAQVEFVSSLKPLSTASFWMNGLVDE